MRYYSIKITNSSGGPPNPNFPVVQGAFVSGSNFTSWANGENIRGAQKVELDISVAPYGVPRGGSRVQVWGVSVQQIGQASDLNGKIIEVYGGLKYGLPLASDADRNKQPGLLTQGIIWWAYGNWIDVEQTLDMVILPLLTSVDQPPNLPHAMSKGQNLKDVMNATLSSAFPGRTIDFNISPNLIVTSDVPAHYTNLESYSKFILALSKNINQSPDYPGVQIVALGNTISVFDGSEQTQNPKQILFQDLIGQPTWLGPNTISFKTVMRHDISPGQFVTLPRSLFTTTQQSLSLLRQGVVFQGEFLVSSVRHIGDSTSSDAGAWVTVFEAVNFPVGNTLAINSLAGFQ